MLTDMQWQFVEAAKREIFILHPPGPMLTNTAWVAAYLLGRLEGVNGTTIEHIAEAGRQAWDIRQPCGHIGSESVECGEPDVHHHVGSQACFQGECPMAHHDHQSRVPFDPVALLRAITIEALTGEPKVREEFGDVTLPSAKCRDCHHDTPHKAHHDSDGDCRDCDFSAGDCASVRCMDQCEVGPCNCQAKCVGETRFVIPRLATEGASDAR